MIDSKTTSTQHKQTDDIKKKYFFSKKIQIFWSWFVEISCTTLWHAHFSWWLHDQNVTSCILVLTTEQTGRREENQLRGENTWLSSYFIITWRPLPGSARSASDMKLDSLKLRGLSRYEAEEEPFEFQNSQKLVFIYTGCQPRPSAQKASKDWSH